MDEINISYFVEKITKGVKKQIKGYVKNIQDEIAWSVRRVEHSVSDFNSLMERTKHIRKDFEAIDFMLKESADNKRLFLEMKILYQEMRNELIDLRLLETEIKQKLALLQSTTNARIK